MENKYRTGWRLLLAIYTLFAFTGHHWIPNDWGALKDDIALSDDWILSRASYPGLFAIGLGLIIGTWLLPEAIKIARKVYGLEPRPRPNMPMWKALDYIINDSRARVKQPGPPVLKTHGPGAGRMMVQVGVQHNDAIVQMNEQIAAGHVQVWGRKKINHDFESFQRPVTTQFWQYSALHPLFVTHDSDESQTMLVDKAMDGMIEAGYAKLMVNRYQIDQTWPRQWLWVKLRNWIRGKPRIEAPL